VVVILLKHDSGIDCTTDAHGWVLQARDPLWAGVNCNWIYAISVARHLCRRRVGAEGIEAEDTKRRLGGPGGRTLFNAADIDPYRHTRVSVTLYHPHG
jgi:hypothetical protein